MLRQTLKKDQVAALKSGQTEKLEVLRYILAQIQNKEIEKKADLSDEETIEVLQKIAKELRESIDAAEKGDRKDLADQNKKQLEIVSSYLPKQLSEDELKSEIRTVVGKNQEIFAKNPKAVIGIVMKELKGRAEPQTIMSILRDELKLSS